MTWLIPGIDTASASIGLVISACTASGAAMPQLVST